MNPNKLSYVITFILFISIIGFFGFKWYEDYSKNNTIISEELSIEDSEGIEKTNSVAIYLQKKVLDSVDSVDLIDLKEKVEEEIQSKGLLKKVTEKVATYTSKITETTKNAFQNEPATKNRL